MSPVGASAPRFRIRAFAPEDFEKLCEIDGLCFEPAVAYSRRELRNYLRLTGAECLVAEAAKQPIGFIVTIYATGAAYIITLDVLPEHRRKAVAAALLEAAENHL